MTFVPYHIKWDKGLFCLVTGELVKLIEKKSNRELEQERKNKGDEFHWKNNMKILWRPWEKEKVSSQQGDNISGSEKKTNWNTSNKIFCEHMRHFLHEGSFTLPQQRQRNVQKKCAARAKMFFCWLELTFFRRCRCCRHLALNNFIFWVKYAYINESFAFSPD